MPAIFKQRTAKTQGPQAAYYTWLEQEVQAAINDPRPRIPHAKVMEKLDAEMKLLEKRYSKCTQKI